MSRRKVLAGLAATIGLAAIGDTACIPQEPTPARPAGGTPTPTGEPITTWPTVEARINAQATVDAKATATAAPVATPEAREVLPYTPDLAVYKDKFIAEGKEVILRGAVTNHFVYKTYDVAPQTFQSDVDWLKQNGANFVVVQWNSGFLKDPKYIPKLLADCEYAKSKGMRVELSLHSRGMKTNPDYEPQQIQVTDEEIIKDWNSLLSHPETAQKFAKAVDIFSPLSEPNFSSGKRGITWKEWKPLALKCSEVIRKDVQKETAVIAICGVDYGADARGFLQDAIDMPNVAVEIHPYDVFVTKGGITGQGGHMDYAGFVQEMKRKGKLVFFGELGHEDNKINPGFVDRQYQFMEQNNVSGAVYGINNTSDFEYGLRPKGKESKAAPAAVKFFQAPKK